MIKKRRHMGLLICAAAVALSGLGNNGPAISAKQVAEVRARTKRSEGAAH